MCYEIKSIDDVRQLATATRGLSGLLDLSFLVKKASQSLRPLLGTDLVAVVLVKGDKDTLDLGLQSVDGARVNGFDNLIHLQLGGIGGQVLKNSEPVELT